MPPPKTARDFYNAGARSLSENKLSDAELQLQASLAKQDERIQPAALYNLGHVRFEQGAAELKKASSPKAFQQRVAAISETGERAARMAENALASGDMQKMIEAYQAGRAVRRETRAAIEAFNRAMETYAATLLKWRRSLGDFRSSAELNPSDTNALHNAHVVEKEIARLIDSIRQMQQAMMPTPGSQSPFGDLMNQLKGRIPKELMPPGAPGDDDEEMPMLESLRGIEEGPSKQGDELPQSLTPEDAAGLLKGLKLDEKQGLPAGRGPDSRPRDRTGRTW